jgi:TniQ/Bacterial regulatory helix-turn-helix protein, lysR family
VNRMRTLPIRVDPLAGEALDSWLAAIAYRTQTAWTDTLAALRPTVSDATTGNALQRNWVVYLRPDEVANIATATGVDAAVVDAMTLARYDGTALTIDKSRRCVTRAFPWGRARNSRYCPCCLADTAGRWQLQWRLGWAFACTVHRCLLVDTCPGCGQTQKLNRHVGEKVPQLTRCTARASQGAGTYSVPCDGDLTTAGGTSLAGDHPALLAQQTVLDIISADRASFGVYAAQPTASCGALADIRAVASRVLAYASREDIAERLPDNLTTAYEQVRSSHTGSGQLPNPANKPGMAAPARAATAAVGVTIALSILGAPDTAAAGSALRWIVHRGRRNGLAVNTTTVPAWCRGATTTLAAVQLKALAPFMKPSDQLRYRTATETPSHPPQGDSNAERLTHQLPTMFWSAWSLRFTVTPCSPLQMRPALSAAMMLMGTKLNLTAAAHRTGSAVTAAGVSRSLHFLSNDPRWSDSLIALARLAEFLSRNTVPIDYARRRHLNYRGLLPDELWAQICQATATTPGAGLKADVARSVLFERLSGLPASRSPFAVNSFAFRSKVAAFPRLLTPDLAAHLGQACRQFLDDHDLTEEPLSWHPPLDLLSGLDLPGGDPSSIDVADLHRLVRAENLAFADVADQLGTTIDVVRHMLEVHPAPVLLTPSQRGSRGTPFAVVKMKLPKTTLVDLYQHQRLSLDQIANCVGSNAKSIARLIRMYEIPRWKPADRTRVAIDPEWLRDHYGTHGRTLTDIGREVGLSVSQMSRRAKAHNIAIRPPGGSSTRHRTLKTARVAAEFPILRPALTDTASWSRLQRFAAAADHNSIRSAARVLGTHWTCLSKQIDRLERDLGGPLLVRTPTRYQRMQLTPLGSEVRTAIRDVLDVPIGELIKDVSTS